MYNWLSKYHPNKPVMLAEWGVTEYTPDISLKPKFFDSMPAQLARYPRIKAVVYFDSPHAILGDTRIDSSSLSLAAFKRLVARPNFALRR
jgi:hypothetical protein